MDNKLLPAIGMMAICLVCIVIILAGVKKALRLAGYDNRRQRATLALTGGIIFGWLILLAVLALAGFFDAVTLPPRIVVAVIIPVVAVLIYSFTAQFKKLLTAVPPHWLLMFQSFRIAVECWLWYALGKGLIPVQMTFEGRNFDIFSGILGLIAGWMIMRKGKRWKTIAIVYNLVGLALLLNIVIVAILSFPGPTRYFMNEPANRIVTEFPFVYLPGVLVVMAFTFHILSLRQVAVAEKKPALS
jgi:hypothetical protein